MPKKQRRFWHLVTFSPDDFLIPYFDFQLTYMYMGWNTGGYHNEGLTTEEKEALPGDVLIRVTDPNYWSYYEWYIKSLNSYYKHFKMYEGYDF